MNEQEKDYENAYVEGWGAYGNVALKDNPYTLDDENKRNGWAKGWRDKKHELHTDIDWS